MDEFNKISNKLGTRKRKVAQSLATIMNAQDSMSGYQALPPLNGPSSGAKRGGKEEKGGGGSELSQHRLGLKRGLVRLDDESVDPVIEEFLQRVHK